MHTVIAALIIGVGIYVMIALNRNAWKETRGALAESKLERMQREENDDDPTGHRITL